MVAINEGGFLRKMEARLVKKASCGP